MPRLPKDKPAPPQLSPRLAGITRDHPGVISRVRRITDGWEGDDPRWDDLQALLDFHGQDVRTNEAARIRKYAEDPRVKSHLLEGEGTGLRMAADLLHLGKD
jgi:hypothetical protein